MDALFSYSKGRSFIHRTPAWIKLLVLIAVPFTVSTTPVYICIGLMALFALFALMSGIGFAKFLRDLRPIVIYCIMIVLIDVVSYLVFDRSRAVVTQSSINLILRLLCAMEVASVFFRTTGNYEITSFQACSLGHAVSFP